MVAEAAHRSLANLADLGPPVGIRVGERDVREDVVDHPVEDVVLVVDVVVERHSLDAQVGPELAHREILEPVLVGVGHGGFDDPFPVERSPRGGGHTYIVSHLILQRRS